MKRIAIPHGLFFIAILFITSCQPSAPSPEPRIETPALPVETLPKPSKTLQANAQLSIGETPMPALPPINENSPLCQVNPDSLLVLNCENGTLAITRADDPRHMDIFLDRAIAFKGDTFSMKAQVVSTPPENQLLDQNQYGLFFVDNSGLYHAVHVSGQYFNFESWSMGGEYPKIESHYNQVFSPLLNPQARAIISTSNVRNPFAN